MTTIFIKSYQKDFKLLYYAIMSINKFVSGNYDVILMIDSGHDLPKNITDILTDKYKVLYVDKVGNGYLHQQYCKITAHTVTSSEYIMFSDSDCIFDHPINVDDFIKDGKPEILYTSWDKVGDAICWKDCTSDFIRQESPYEFMRRNCLIYHRSTLEAISNFDVGLRYRIMKCERFSEFNAIGAYAWFYERDKYNFINTDEWEYTPPKGTQLWSLAEKEGNETHRKEYQRSIDTINKVFDLNITEI